MEEWRKIEDYHYSVSNKGRVRNDETGRILKIRINKQGYHSCALSKHSIMKSYRIPRLVAQYFIPNHQNKPCVNHKNLIKSDNRVENLEWVTYKENTKHAIINGCANVFTKGNIPLNAKLNLIKLKRIRKMFNTNQYTQTELSRIYNISVSQINSVVRNKSWVKYE